MERRMQVQVGIDRGMVARAISLGTKPDVADTGSVDAQENGSTPKVVQQSQQAFSQLAMPDTAVSDAPVRCHVTIALKKHVCSVELRLLLVGSVDLKVRPASWHMDTATAHSGVCANEPPDIQLDNYDPQRVHAEHSTATSAIACAAFRGNHHTQHCLQPVACKHCRCDTLDTWHRHCWQRCA